MRCSRALLNFFTRSCHNLLASGWLAVEDSRAPRHYSTTHFVWYSLHSIFAAKTLQGLRAVPMSFCVTLVTSQCNQHALQKVRYSAPSQSYESHLCGQEKSVYFAFNVLCLGFCCSLQFFMVLISRSETNIICHSSGHGLEL